MSAHRIPLDVFEGLEGEWVEVHERRNYGTRNRVNDAVAQGFLAFNRTRMALYVKAWSLPGDPANEAVIDELDDEVAAYILEQAEEHYGRSRRTSAERKSTESEASEGLRLA